MSADDDNATKTEIGNIGNYYGGLTVVKSEAVFYWGIENWDGTRWEEIPEALYDSLIAYEESRKKQEG